MGRFERRSKWMECGMAAIAALVIAATAAAEVVSDNLSNATTDTESAIGERWLTASFTTGSDDAGYELESVTLLLANTSAGEANLHVFSDGGLEPGVLFGTLTAPAIYSADLAETVFPANGIQLAADSTYWLVLEAASGAFAWGWSVDSSGEGSGFDYTWGECDDAGETWFTHAIYPTQMRVVVPEPHTLGEIAAGSALAAVSWLSRNRRTEDRRDDV